MLYIIMSTCQIFVVACNMIKSTVNFSYIDIIYLAEIYTIMVLVSFLFLGGFFFWGGVDGRSKKRL